MKCVALVLLTACGGATSSLSVATSVESSVGSSVNVTSSLDEAPSAPPENIDVHLHETPSYTADGDKLYVEITSEHEHGELLIKSATAGLSSTDYVVAVREGGDVELHVEVETFETSAQGTSCRLKIFVLRMPQHDLLAIADGGAQVTGRRPSVECLSATSTAIVRDKLPALFQRQLEFKQ